MKNKQIFVGITGQPNCGKSSMFNALTGSVGRVGNYPGITVECMEGHYKFKNSDDKLRIVDLPGTYSLTSYSADESVATKLILEQQPDVLVCMLDATTLERSLYLAIQLMELGVPIVIGLNMMDEVERKGITIDVEKLKAVLGVPVVKCIARKGEGKQQLADAVLAQYKKYNADSDVNRVSRWSGINIGYGSDLDPVIKDIAQILKDDNFDESIYSAHWAAIKYAEDDKEFVASIKENHPAADAKISKIIGDLTSHLEKTLHTYPEAVIADYRYGYISSILKNNEVIHYPSDMRFDFTDKVDLILTNRVLGPIIMCVVLYLLFYITINIGAIPQGWCEAGFGYLKDIAENNMTEGLFKSLVTNGIIDGVGSVLSFTPLIFVMFIQLCFLEDLGYMSRVAYMLDRLFRICGLHGASVMPFIISGGIPGGCAVPGVMATRTLRCPRERLATILVAPFTICGAKLTPLVILVAAFFDPKNQHENKQVWILFLITIGCWIAALSVARVLRWTIIKGEPTPFVMELPPYRMPTFYGVMLHSGERAWQYAKKAGTVILAISIIIWAMMTFPQLDPSEYADHSSEKEKLESELVIAETAFAPIAEQHKSVSDKISGLEKEIESHKMGKKLIEQTKAEAQLALLNTKLTIINKTYEPKYENIALIKHKISNIDNHISEERLRHSYAGQIGIKLESVSQYAGFPWQVNIALVGGFTAKEVVVSVLNQAYGMGAEFDEESEDNKRAIVNRLAVEPAFKSMPAKLSIILFVMLYAPCFVTIVVIGRETKWRWALFSLVGSTTLAFIISVIVFQVGKLF
ncbi:ferrous iron transport protein B [Lentisphaerota bacterium WC36G]|nr:ferrous iron transport protein B [Lentisphaerae bacterium WC36]